MAKSHDLSSALTLFGLNEKSDEAELTVAYHRLLFQVHPDTTKGDLPELRVDELIAARNAISQFISERDSNLNKQPVEKEDGPGREGYLWYKEASRIFAEALEAYWKERLKYSQMPSDSIAVVRFHSELMRARELFASVLLTYPAGIWTADAVEKIAKINSWIGAD